MDSQKNQPEKVTQSPQAAALLANGATFGNHYVITECLAVGKKAVFYKCHHRDLPERSLALAVLHPSTTKNDPTAIARFKKGMSASFVVCHPNVLRTYEFLTEGETMAYTMEYAPNGNLDDLLSAAELPPMEDVTRIALQVCAGLKAIHDGGIVHRDLRPKNILFNQDNAAMISGFGIALVADAPRVTSHGDVVGTAGYASPEYLQVGKVDKRSDIYALGLILYEMTTGAFPFTDSNPIAAITARLTTDPIAPREIRSECSVEMNNVILRAMTRDPEKRYQDASEMLEELKKAAGPIAVPVAAHVEPAISAEPELPTNWEIGGDSNPAESAEPTELEVATLSAAQLPKIKRSVAVGTALLVASVFAFLVISDRTTHQNNPELSRPIVPEVAVATTAPTAPENKISTGDTPAVEPTPAAEPEAVTVAAAAPESDPQPVAAQPQPDPETVATTDTLIKAEESATPTAQRTRTYHVLPGDTVSGLAGRFSLSQEEIIRLNHIPNRNLLISGTELQLPVQK